MKIFYLLLLLASTIPLAAQTDVRVSAPGRRLYPAQYNTQSIANIGTRSLLVFGSSDAQPVTNAAIQVLRVQLLEGSQPRGAQRNLTDDTASRPSGVVRVFAGTDRFFVFFNDTRADRPGLYLQVVGLDGANIGTAELVSTRRIGNSNPGLVLAGTAASGYQIVWSDGTSSPLVQIYGRRMDAQGLLQGAETRLGGLLGGTITVTGLPGLTVLYFPQDTSRLIHANGRLDPRPLSTPRFGVPYYIGADSSLATLNGDTIRIYSNLFAPTAAQTILLPASIAGTRSHSRAITRNAAGDLQVYYITVLDTLPNLHYAIERITINGATPSAPTRLVDRIAEPDTVDQMTSSRVSLVPSFVARACNQRYGIGARLTFATVTPSGPNNRVETVSYTLDGNGNFAANDSLNQIPCVPATGYSVARQNVDSMSRIFVRVQQDSLLVEHPRPWTIEQVPERSPNVYQRSGQLYTAWTTTADSNTTLLQALNGTFGVEPTSAASYSRAGRSIRIPGAQILEARQIERLNDTTIRSRYTLHVGGIIGWTVAVGIDEVRKDTIEFRFEDAASDPNRNEIVSVVTVLPPAQGPRTAIYGADENGEYLWRIDSLPVPSGAKIQVVPTGEVKYILVGGNTAVRFDREQPVGTFTFPSQWPDAHYQRLLGDRFLRWHFSSLDHTQIDLEIYDLEGKRLRSGSIVPGRPVVGDPFFVQRPSDGMLAALYSGDGIRVAYGDTALRFRYFDAPVSDVTSNTFKPAGVFLDDTLQTVWEDHRRIVVASIARHLGARDLRCRIDESFGDAEPGKRSDLASGRVACGRRCADRGDRYAGRIGASA
jgi:hypothetical protein